MVNNNFKIWMKNNPKKEMQRRLKISRKLRANNGYKNKMILEEIVCKSCGKRVIKKIDLRRKNHFCSRECFYKSDIPKKNITNYRKLNGTYHTSYNYARQLGLKNMPNVCRCGSIKNIIIHHKDGNRKNNKPENLEILCESCHHKQDNRIFNIPKEKCGNKIGYERNKEMYEMNRLENGRFGRW